VPLPAAGWRAGDSTNSAPVFGPACRRARGTIRPTIRSRAPLRRRSTRVCESSTAAGRSITTFGPYSPGQAVGHQRLGIEIYSGAGHIGQGSVTEDPGADPRATRSIRCRTRRRIVRALVTADKIRRGYARARMSPEQRANDPAVDYSAVHPSRCRHGTWRRRARQESDPRGSSRSAFPATTSEDQNQGVRSAPSRGKVLVSQTRTDPEA